MKEEGRGLGNSIPTTNRTIGLASSSVPLVWLVLSNNGNFKRLLVVIGDPCSVHVK